MSEQWPGVEITDDHWPGTVVDSGQDYDFKSAAQAGESPDASGHWTDKYKKPNHPTFSDESIYAKDGTPGHWQGETFIPPGEKSASTRSFYGLPKTAPIFAPTPERVGPDPNDPQAPDFPSVVFSGPGIPRPFEQQKGMLAQIGAGIGNAPSDFANFALSGPGVATAGILPTLAPAIQRLVALGFTVDQAKNAIQADTTQEMVGSLAGAAVTGLGVIKPASELMRLPKEGPKVVEPVKTTQEARSVSVDQSSGLADQSAPEQSVSASAASDVPPETLSSIPRPQPEALKSGEQSQTKKDSGLKEADVTAVPPQGQNAPQRTSVQDALRALESMPGTDVLQESLRVAATKVEEVKAKMASAANDAERSRLQSTLSEAEDRLGKITNEILAPSVPESNVAGAEEGLPPKASESVSSTKNEVTSLERENRPIDIDEGPRTTGIAQRIHEERGSGVQPGEGMGPEDAVNLGRADLKAGADPHAIAAKIDRSEAITARETGILRAHVEELSKASSRAQDAVDLQPTNPVLRRAANEAFAAETAFRKRIKPAATEWQRVGATMQGATDIDTGSFTALRRMVNEEKGRDIKPHEEPRLRQAASKVQMATRAEAAARTKLGAAVKEMTRQNRMPKTKEELQAHFAEKFKKLLPCP
jgi:hypothetical protein